MKKSMTLVFGLLSTFAFGQNIHRCYTVEMMQQMEEAHPGYIEDAVKTFEMAKERAQAKSSSQEIYRIPVVVHVLYNTNEENLPDSLIYNQIEVLNQAYNRTNPDTSLTRDVFKPVAGNAGVEFYLAYADPDGNWTSGIDRVQTATTSFFSINTFTPDGIKDSNQGGVDAWPTDRYLNIWVGNLSFLGSPFILGFAYPPVGAPNWPQDQFPADPGLEGVVVHYEVFGRNNPLTAGLLETTDQGRTCVHEVGHFLGLRHIWGDGGGFSGTDGCTVDDGLEDTPNASDASQQECDLNKNSCADSPIDFPDMIENFMDYSDEHCMNMFTIDQVGIMRSILETTRNGLIAPLASTSIEQFGLHGSGLAVYPNPSSGKINVSYNNSFAAIHTATAFDAFGRVIQSNNIQSSLANFELDFTGLSAGVYFLHFQSEKDLVVRKLVIE